MKHPISTSWIPQVTESMPLDGKKSRRPTIPVTQSVQQRINCVIKHSLITHAETAAVGGFSERWLQGMLSKCDNYDETVMIKLARALAVPLARLTGEQGDPIQETDRTEPLLQFLEKLLRARGLFPDPLQVPRGVSAAEIGHLRKSDLLTFAELTGRYAHARQLHGDLLESYQGSLLQSQIFDALRDYRSAIKSLLCSFVPARHLAISSFLKHSARRFNELMCKLRNESSDLGASFLSELCQIDFEFGWCKPNSFSNQASAIIAQLPPRTENLASIRDRHFRRHFHLVGENNLESAISPLLAILGRLRDRCDGTSVSNVLLSIIALYTWHDQIQKAFEFLRAHENEMQLAPRGAHAFMLASKGYLLVRLNRRDEAEPFLAKSYEEIHRIGYCPASRPDGTQGRSIGFLWRPDLCLPKGHALRQALGDLREHGDYPFIGEPLLTN